MYISPDLNGSGARADITFLSLSSPLFLSLFASVTHCLYFTLLSPFPHFVTVSSRLPPQFCDSSLFTRGCSIIGMRVSCKANIANHHRGSSAWLTTIQTLLSTQLIFDNSLVHSLASMLDVVPWPVASRCPADYSSHHPFQPHHRPEMMGGVGKTGRENARLRKPRLHSMGSCWPGLGPCFTL